MLLILHLFKVDIKVIHLIALAQLVSTIDDQLRSLLSMVIDGFPPLEQSEYIHKAEYLL